MPYPELVDADEARHPAGAEELWGESWYLDFAAADGSYGGYVRLGLYPNLDRAWWWIALVGAGEPTVLVVDHALACPAGADAHPQVSWPAAFDRFRVHGKGAGVRLADPADAFRGLPGEPVDVAIDLEWSSRGPAFPYAMTTRYEISSWVTGSCTIGERDLPVDCAGQRDHSWGVRDWWQFPWNWTAGHLSDGTFFHAARSIIPDLELFGTGYVIPPGGSLQAVESPDITVRVDVDEEKLPVHAEQRIGPLRFTTEYLGHAPVLLVASDGRESRFPRAMCRFTTEDGRTGTGWSEFNWPPGFPAPSDRHAQPAG
jgi:hypothetical protein